jgi:glycine cleavage system pyridoxal-binding protein P
MGFGGPYSGFFSTKEENVRKMPGRIIGRSIDA